MTSRTVPLHLATFAIVTPNNNPLYVHSYTGVQDELRYHHIAHSALDIIEERESNVARKEDNFLGLLFSMDDLAVYGYRTASRLRIIVSLGLIDGIIKDSDVVTICRTIHQLYNTASANPFLLLNSNPTPKAEVISPLPPISDGALSLSTLPRPEDLRLSGKMKYGAERLGRLLNGGRS
ncbi:hypothetical protein FFLO_00282 [Filobasidium floriforme]|uniref:Trafficking protein particle complex subunit 2-like protein n=1 Tax=Filobasidium floriforme TaxID=5210 RepID=A0A8K0NVU7_9TREE|nr:Sedlin, N-terminal conserved region-domain-containing protein [Filobasidium floriforme]KAG7575463.1 hypothetical protein FFLO_00282 [Filobasidium floriforme]KAH8082600.1 Sedlin, N-terminal conserved region-domain-containing protein [Filobasidium floriforme]